MRFVALALLFPALAFANSDPIDAELNAVYKHVLQSFPNSKALVIQAQRDWLKFSKSHCDAYMSWDNPHDPTFYSINQKLCIDDLKKERIKQLKEFQ